MKEEICQNCSYWKGVGDDSNLESECHRHAPVVLGSSNGFARTAWPWTRKKDTCGDFDLYVSPVQKEWT